MTANKIAPVASALQQPPSLEPGTLWVAPRKVQQRDPFPASGYAPRDCTLEIAHEQPASHTHII